MFESGQNWELFGYDVRNVGRHWMAAWREFLWAYDSPLRQKLDEAVVLHDGVSEQSYHAGLACGRIETDCQAVLLPDELVLSKRLSLPPGVETDLESVIAMEVAASSPFGAEDTAFGWRETGRSDQGIGISLVIISKSAAMTYIAQNYGSHDAKAQEVWARVDGQAVVLQGFGEHRRAQRYRSRLMRVSGMLVAAAMFLLIGVAASAGLKRLELRKVEALAARAQTEAAVASRHRSTLGQGNETVSVINELAALYPSPHLQLAQLTRLLGDDAYVERFSSQGLEIDLRGRAGSAAVMMQELSEQPAYADVVAVSPIRRIPNSDVEQFHLKIRLEGGS